MVASAAIGGRAGPTRKAPRCTKTTGVGTGLAVAIRNVSAGATICLNSGSYGAVTFRSLSKSSTVTVRPAAGANVTIGEVHLQVVSHLRFAGLGGTMSVNGVEVDDSDTRPKCSNHLTFDHLKFTAALDILPRCAAMAILVDHANFNDVGPGGAGEGKINVQAMDQGPAADQGITISNSTFNGTTPSDTKDCSKGIQVLGGAYGVRILNNEFAFMPNQSTCDAVNGIHIGGVQNYGGRYMTLQGNYFHDNNDAAGGLSEYGDHDLIADNVWVCTCLYPWSIQARSSVYTVFRHNTFAGGGGLHFQSDGPGIYPHDNHIYDNVFTDSGNAISDSSGSNWGTEDHNLNSGLRGSGNLKGRPVFVGGKKPKSYQGYRLARGSRGKGAASDGRDLGIRTAATACKRGSVAARVGGKRVCLKTGKRCKKRYDRQYRKHGFRCVKGRLRKLPKHARR
jgi:hypothetical protein